MLDGLSSENGQDLVEYALIFPLLMLLLLGIMEFGIVVQAYDSIANAAREGARYGIVHPDNSPGIKAAALRSTMGLDQAALLFTISQIGDTIQVEVDYDHGFITGFIIQVLGGNPTLHLHSAATMRIE